MSTERYVDNSDEETSKPLEKGSTNPEATRTKGRVTTSQWDDKCPKWFDDDETTGVNRKVK